MTKQPNQQTQKPLIGVNLDFCTTLGLPEHPLLGGTARTNTFTNAPHHTINLNYILAIEQAGGIPIPIPHAFSTLADYTHLVDAFVFSGGLVDLPPEVYGEATNTHTLYRQDQRTRFDIALMQEALDQNKPILGVCAGCQLLNVVRGGTLHQHIPDSYPLSEIEHFNYANRHSESHTVTLTEGSRLHQTLGTTSLGVNSSHHMAIKKPGSGLKITAHSPDGIAEGVECMGDIFIVGVQWHPEFFRQQVHQNLFNTLVEEAVKTKKVAPWPQPPYPQYALQK